MVEVTVASPPVPVIQLQADESAALFLYELKQDGFGEARASSALLLKSFDEAAAHWYEPPLEVTVDTEVVMVEVCVTVLLDPTVVVLRGISGGSDT